MLGGINYSTEKEKDEESRTVKYAYQTLNLSKILDWFYVLCTYTYKVKKNALSFD